MRYRFLLLLVIVLAVLSPLPLATAQTDGDGFLSPDEIDQIAPSVVQILLLVDGEPQSTGSGTIADASGRIFTNRHVVAGGDDFIIYLLEDVNERPVARYRASVTHYAADYDFAVLQIDRDLEGNPINPSQLNLPVFSGNTISTPARRGDTIYVFGYPGVGDGYLVVTTGSIASVQNDEIVLGQTIPVWYQTDAEIAPGNSGGLAVNGNGEYIGIPTAVRSEERTGGRLSYILTFEAISDIIEASNKGEEGYLIRTDSAPEETTSGPSDCPPLEYGDTVEANISGDTYLLGFCLNAEEGDVLSVEMNTTSGDLDGYLAIYDPVNETILVENDDRSEDDRDPQIANFEIPADGEYIIIASRFRFEDGETAGDFELIVSDSGGEIGSGGGGGSLDGFLGGGNSSCAALVEGLNVPDAEIGSLSYGDSVESDITNSTNVALYCFNAQAGDVIDVDMSTTSGDLDGLVGVYDPASDTLLVQNDDRSEADRNPFIDDFTIPADGTYVVVASRYLLADGETTGSYRLTLTTGSGGEGSILGGRGSGGEVCAAAIDTYFETGAVSGTVAYGDTVRGTINDDDYGLLYCFEVSAGDVVQVDMQTIGGDLDGQVAIYDPVTEEIIVQNDDRVSSNLNPLIDGFTMPRDGAFFIFATRYNTDEGETSGDFELTLTRQ